MNYLNHLGRGNLGHFVAHSGGSESDLEGNVGELDHAIATCRHTITQGRVNQRTLSCIVRRPRTIGAAVLEDD